MLKIRGLALIGLSMALSALFAAAAIARSAETVLYDTLVPSASPIDAGTIKEKSGWKSVAADAPVAGDAVIENNLITVHCRRGDGRWSIFYKIGGTIRLGAELAAIGDDDPAVSANELLAATGDDGVAVAWRGTTAAGRPRSLKCRLQGGRPSLSCSAEGDVARLSLSFPGGSGHALVPDIFGDDVVLRAAESARSERRPAAEHAVIYPLDGGDALLVCSWHPAPKDIAAQLGSGDKSSAFIRSDIPCGESEPISISVLAGEGIWFETDAALYNSGEYRKLDWKPPFPAQYRCDLRQSGTWKLTDSWRRATTKDRTWYSFLNYCFPPLCLNNQGAWLRLPKFLMSGAPAANLPREINYAGPILIYPFAAEMEERRGKTPKDAWTVLDVLRDTLGEGWTKILDIGPGILKNSPYPEGFVYVATCAATEEVEKIFGLHQEKEEAKAIRRWFDDMNKFVVYNRARLDEYVAFAKTYGDYLEEHRKAHPADADLDRALAELAPLIQYLTDRFLEKKEIIKTPEYCRSLTEKIIELIDGADADKIGQVKKLGREIRTIGGAQDDLLGAFRMSLKILRQRAGQIHADAEAPRVRKVMRDIRRLTLTILRLRSPYEGH